MSEKQNLEADIPCRPILYTDEIDGKMVGRDDLWAVSTQELNDLWFRLQDALDRVDDLERRRGIRYRG